MLQVSQFDLGKLISFTHQQLEKRKEETKGTGKKNFDYSFIFNTQESKGGDSVFSCKMMHWENDQLHRWCDSSSRDECSSKRIAKASACLNYLLEYVTMSDLTPLLLPSIGSRIRESLLSMMDELRYSF
jgi:hypothetical protein